MVRTSLGAWVAVAGKTGRKAPSPFASRRPVPR